MRSVLVLGVILMICGCFADDCSLPWLEDGINWDMLPDRWYQMYNSRDPVDNVIPCYILENMRSDGNGGSYVKFRAVVNKTRSSETDRLISQHWELQPDTAYRYDDNYKRIWLDAVKSASSQKDEESSQKAIKEADDFFKIPLTFITDYEHYFVGMECTHGERYVWVHGRHNRGTDKDIKIVRKALAEIGDGWDKVPLYPAGCSDMQFSKHII